MERGSRRATGIRGGLLRFSEQSLNSRQRRRAARGGVRAVDEKIKHALANDQVIDITTIGRQSGQPRRLEIWFHNIDGRLYITGLPGTRDWYANLVAHPAFT